MDNSDLVQKAFEKYYVAFDNLKWYEADPTLGNKEEARKFAAEKWKIFEGLLIDAARKA